MDPPPPRTSRPAATVIWRPPTVPAYRVFLGLWMALYAAIYGGGLWFMRPLAQEMDIPAAALVLAPLIGSVLLIKNHPRLAWGFAALGTAALVWRLLRLGTPAPLLWLAALATIPVLAGIPIGWAENRLNRKSLPTEDP